MTPSPEPRPAVHALYRFRGHDDELLYVGITNNPGRRWTEHQKSKPWWHEVHRVDVEHHPDRPAVLLAESAAIRTERPRYNIAGTNGSTPAAIGYRVECGQCDRGAIGVYVLSAEIHAYDTWRKKINDPHAAMDDVVIRGGQLDEVPFPVRWHGCCALHLPDDGRVHYWIDGITSRAAAVDAVRHLADKEWVGELTAWGDLAARLLAPAEAALPRGHHW